jgi:hypothetical protein
LARPLAPNIEGEGSVEERRPCSASRANSVFEIVQEPAASLSLAGGSYRLVRFKGESTLRGMPLGIGQSSGALPG